MGWTARRLAPRPSRSRGETHEAWWRVGGGGRTSGLTERGAGRVWAWCRRGVSERSMSYAYLFKYIIIGDTGKRARGSVGCAG